MRLLTLLICMIGVNCSLAQAQSAQASSKYEPEAPEKVMRGDTADISESITENILARIDGRVVQEMERAWRLVGAGADAKEGVLLLFRMLDGSIQARPAGVTNEHKSFTIQWHPSAIAILHTHPNSVNPRPSGPDRRLAENLRVPIFTLTIRGMFVYDPRTKTMSQIQNGLDWLDLSKWKSNKL